MRLRIVFAAILTIPCLAHAQTPRQRYQAAKTVYAKHAKTFFHDNTPQAIQALREMWSSAADAVIAELTAHPKASAADLDIALCLLDEPPASCTGQFPDAVQFTPGTWLIEQRFDEVGTVFVIGSRDGKPALLWSIASIASQQRDSRRMLDAWRPERAADNCRTRAPANQWDRCGPLFATVGILPSDGGGHPRFFIDAQYAEGGGMDAGRQMSLWRWTRDRAELLRTFPYEIMIDQHLGTRFAGDTLVIAEREEFRSFNSYAPSEARLMLHRIRFTPKGMTDLGKTAVVPEFDLVDDLFWRLTHHQPTAAIASAQVASIARTLAPDLGLLETISIIRNGQTTIVCLVDDGIGHTDFTVENKSGKPRLEHATHLPDQWACPGATKSK